MIVKLHRDPSAFSALASEWSALLAHSASNTVFLTPEYQRTWWHHLGGGRLCLLTVHQSDELLGVAPLFIGERDVEGQVLRTIGCVEVSDYLDWVVAKGREREVLEALMHFLESAKAPSWNLMDLCNIRQDSPTLSLLTRLANAHGWDATTQLQDMCPVVNLGTTWDEYLASLTSKDRHELRRKLRRAETTTGLDWYVVGPKDDLDAELEDFLDLMARSSPRKADFLTRPMWGFFRGLGRVAFEAGWLQLSFLRIKGRKIASCFNFVYKNQILAYNSGLHLQVSPELAAGIVLTGFLIRDAIREGRETYDFLRGDEGYKYRFGAKNTQVHRLLIRP